MVLWAYTVWSHYVSRICDFISFVKSETFLVIISQSFLIIHFLPLLGLQWQTLETLALSLWPKRIFFLYLFISFTLGTFYWSIRGVVWFQFYFWLQTHIWIVFIISVSLLRLSISPPFLLGIVCTSFKVFIISYRTWIFFAFPRQLKRAETS